MDEHWRRRVEYGNFSLAQFCDDAAALAKYLIRARERIAPGFLEDTSAYDAWKLDNIREDNITSSQLLRMALVSVHVIDAHMVSHGGSGGVMPEDPLGDFKFDVATLTTETALDQAIRSLELGEQIEWENLAHWHRLPAIRMELNRLYEHVKKLLEQLCCRRKFRLQKVVA